jgi:hypothetical protein
MMLIVLVWIGISIVIGIGAKGRGRSGFAWFLLAILLSPLIAGLLLVVLPDLYMRDLLQRSHRDAEASRTD